MKSLMIGTIIVSVCLPFINYEVEASLTEAEELALASGSDFDRKILAQKIAAKGNLPNFLASLGAENPDILNLQSQINNAKVAVGTIQPGDPTLANRIAAVQQIIPGISLINGAQQIQAKVATAIAVLDSTPNQTLPGATQAVTNVVSTGGVGGNRGANVLTDVTAARDALPNAGGGDLKARALAIGGTVNTAITALDTTVGQTLPGATQAVTNVVSTGGVGGNRGADVLTDVTAARDALPNAGAGDLKARALAVGGTINTAISEIDPVKTTLPAAVTSIMDTPTNYNSVWNFASGINPAYVVGAGTGNANEASLRNEIIILLNIIQSINQTTHQITRPDGLTANHSNVTLRDLIRFLSQRTSLQ